MAEENQTMEAPDIEAFLCDLIAKYREHDCMDIDGADFQDLCVKHRLMVERPATVEEAAEDWAQEYDIEEGDMIVADSPWLEEVRARRAR